MRELRLRVINAVGMARTRGLYYAWVALWTPSGEYQ